MANLPSEKPLDKKVILVTGAAKRIGRDIALRLAREGASVAIHYNTSRLEAERTAEECGAAEIFQANLESVDEIRRMFDEVLQRHLPSYSASAAAQAELRILDSKPARATAPATAPH